jgi:hypothetical protein
MHPDIARAISVIDSQIRELEKAKRILIDTFGESNSGVSTIHAPQHLLRKKTRKDEVVKLIREAGALSRGEIVHKTGIPVGTVSFILNNKSLFINRNGKWDLVGKEEEAQASLLETK